MPPVTIPRQSSSWTELLESSGDTIRSALVPLRRGFTGRRRAHFSKQKKGAKLESSAFENRPGFVCLIRRLYRSCHLSAIHKSGGARVAVPVHYRAGNKASAVHGQGELG